VKIIGKSESGFIISATQEELMLCAGCDHMETFVKQNGDAFVNTKSSYKWEWSFKIGAEFDVTTSYKWMQKLRETEKQILASAEILSNLSEMLRGGIPSAIIGPSE